MDATNGTDIAVTVDRAGSDNTQPVGQLTFAQHIHDREGERKPCRWPANPAGAHVDLDGKLFIKHWQCADTNKRTRVFSSNIVGQTRSVGRAKCQRDRISAHGLGRVVGVDSFDQQVNLVTD